MYFLANIPISESYTLKGVGFVTGGLIDEDRRGQSMNALMHITDWYPTLCTMAGIELDTEFSDRIDGFDQSDNILEGETEMFYPRENIVHNVLALDCGLEVCGAVRYRNYKLVVGNEVDFSGSDICVSTWCALDDQPDIDTATVQCTEKGNYMFPDVNTTTDCPYNGEACLYDLSVDPCEYYDIKGEEPEVYEMLYQLLVDYNQSAVTPTLYELYPDQLNASDPTHFGGFWTPWIDIDIEVDVTRGHDGELYLSLGNGVKLITSISTVMIKDHLFISLSVVFVVVLSILSLIKLCLRQKERSGYKSIES